MDPSSRQQAPPQGREKEEEPQQGEENEAMVFGEGVSSPPDSPRIPTVRAVALPLPPPTAAAAAAAAAAPRGTGAVVDEEEEA